MGTGRRRSLVGGQGQGQGGGGAGTAGGGYAMSQRVDMGAADPRACWGGAEVVQHQVVQTSWPGGPSMELVLEAP